jgi:TonB-linked SusC/RagA family outer membrane protein
MKLILKFFCCILFAISFHEQSFAQQKLTVTGKIINQKTGDPLLGATVNIKGNKTSVTTDKSGNFEINIPQSNAVLLFSYVGMTSQEIPITQSGIVNVNLIEKVGNNTEVVVVGYGKQSRRNVSGAISTITTDDIKRNPVADLSNTLVGRVTGIIAKQAVGEPGQDRSKIYVRGVSTFSSGDGATDPLFVIDGIVRSQTDFSKLDANEVESVNVLKDASSAAIFGVRGANGVIMVTTKRGKVGKLQASYTFNYAWQKVTSLPDFLGSDEYASLYNEALVNNGRPIRFSATDIQKYKDGSDPDKYANTDWAKLLLGGSAPQMQHNLNLRGGSEKAKYFVSIGYLDQRGLYSTLGFKKYSLRSNLDLQLTNTTTLTVDLSGRLENTKTPSTGSTQIFQEAFRNPPIFPAQYQNGNIANIQPYPNPFGYIQKERGYGTNQNNVLLTNLQLNQEIPWVKGLSLKGVLAFDKSYGRYKNWTDNLTQYTKNPDNTYTPTAYAKPSLNEGYGQYAGTELQFQINYARRFNNHGVSALVLFLAKNYQTDYLNGSRKDYASSALDVINAGPSLNQTLNGGTDQYGSKSTAARINYDFKNKYLLQLSIRQDQSENFAPAVRKGYFPAASVGWIVSAENFMQSVKQVDFLKLRASYGKLGNDAIASRFGYYARYDLYSPGGPTAGGTPNNFGGYAFGGQFVNGLAPGPLANDKVKWEASTKTDIGIEGSFFNKLIGVEFDYFNERRTGILAQPFQSVPTSFGATLPTQNIGIVNNKGFEFTLSHENRINKNLSYFVRGNITKAKNEIIFQDESPSASTDLKTTGRPIGGYYGLKSNGLFRDQKDFDNSPHTAYTTLGPGDIKYVDINADGKIDDKDRTYLGTNNIPGVIYGISGGVNFKNFQLNFLFQGAAKVYQQLSQNAVWAFYNGGKVTSEWRDRWTPDNPNASLPRVLLVAENNQLVSDFWIKDASYLRLKNVELAYTIPSKIISRLRITGIRVYASGQNLATFTKLRNVDPENTNTQGWYYPQQKTYNFGISVEF